MLCLVILIAENKILEFSVLFKFLYIYILYVLCTLFQMHIFLQWHHIPWRLMHFFSLGKQCFTLSFISNLKVHLDFSHSYSGYLSEWYKFPFLCSHTVQFCESKGGLTGQHRVRFCFCIIEWPLPFDRTIFFFSFCSVSDVIEFIYAIWIFMLCNFKNLYFTCPFLPLISLAIFAVMFKILTCLNVSLVLYCYWNSVN